MSSIEDKSSQRDAEIIAHNVFSNAFAHKTPEHFDVRTSETKPIDQILQPLSLTFRNNQNFIVHSSFLYLFFFKKF